MALFLLRTKTCSRINSIFMNPHEFSSIRYQRFKFNNGFIKSLIFCCPKNEPRNLGLRWLGNFGSWSPLWPSVLLISPCSYVQPFNPRHNISQITVTWQSHQCAQSSSLLSFLSLNFYNNLKLNLCIVMAWETYYLFS